MGKSYSLDLRERVIAFVEGGRSRRAASLHFDVSESVSVKLMQHVAKLGSAAPARQGRPPGAASWPHMRPSSSAPSKSSRTSPCRS